MPIISKVPEIVKREFALEDYVLLAIEKYARWRKQQNAGARTATPPPRSGQKA